jgi:hypothetical protein
VKRVYLAFDVSKMDLIATTEQGFSLVFSHCYHLFYTLGPIILGRHILGIFLAMHSLFGHRRHWRIIAAKDPLYGFSDIFIYTDLLQSRDGIFELFPIR